MLEIYFSARFKRDYKRIQRQGKNMEMLLAIVDILANRQPLAEKYHDHVLSGEYQGHRECHIEPDWLLVYKADEKRLILTLTRTGSHSELFRK